MFLKVGKPVIVTPQILAWPRSVTEMPSLSWDIPSSVQLDTIVFSWGAARLLTVTRIPPKSCFLTVYHFRKYCTLISASGNSAALFVACLLTQNGSIPQLWLSQSLFLLNFVVVLTPVGCVLSSWIWRYTVTTAVKVTSSLQSTLEANNWAANAGHYLE